MNIYKSIFFGKQIDQILTQAKRFYLDLSVSKWEDLIYAANNNVPIFIVESENIMYYAVSRLYSPISVTLTYWNGEEFVSQSYREGEDGLIATGSIIIPSDKSIKIIIDKFINPEEGITTRQERAEDGGFETWEEYLDWYFNTDEPGSITTADTYYHTDKTIEWDNTEYDIWIHSNYEEIPTGNIIYILTEKYDFKTFKERSLKNNNETEWNPVIAMLKDDLSTSYYNNEKTSLDWLVDVPFDVESDNTRRIWFDTFITDVPFQDRFSQYFRYPSWQEYLNETIQKVNEGTFDGNVFTYIDETIEWEGNTYYLWENVNFDNGCPNYLITEYLDQSEFMPRSLESNPNNEWCPYIALLDDDKEVVYTDESRFDWLVAYRPNTIYFDRYCEGRIEPPYSSKEIYNQSDTVKSFEDYIQSKLTVSSIGENNNKFEYTGKLQEYEGENYYLWLNTNPEHDKDNSYLLTTTINLDELYNNSLEKDSSKEYCPYVAILDDSLNVSYIPEDKHDWLLVLGFPQVDEIMGQGGNVKLWIDHFDNKESLIEDWGCEDWENFVSEYLFNPSVWEEGFDYLGAEPYCLTEEILEWENKIYYIWEYDGVYDEETGQGMNIYYLLTDTDNIDELSEKSIYVNHNINETPYFATLTVDSNIYRDVSGYPNDLVVVIEKDGKRVKPKQKEISLYIDRPDHCEVSIEELVDNPEECGANKYTYMNETIKWEDSYYYLWEYSGTGWPSSNKYNILTDTINYDNLYPNSLEADHNNHWCPYITYLDEDLETGYDVDEAGRREDEVLVKIISEEQPEPPENICIYIDRVRETDMDDQPIEIDIESLVNDPISSGASQFVYLKTTFEWDGTEYYLWQCSDGDIYDDKYYLLTSTVDYDTLYSQSLEADYNNRYNPVITYFNEDLESGYNEHGYEVLVKIEEFTGQILVPENINIKLYLDNPERIDEGLTIEELIADPLGNCMSAEYTYTKRVFKWEDTYYYLWELTAGDVYDNGLTMKQFLLTDTIDYNTLYSNSLEADHNNHWCPPIMLADDLETEYLQQYNKILVKVVTYETN